MGTRAGFRVCIHFPASGLTHNFYSIIHFGLPCYFIFSVLLRVFLLVEAFRNRTETTIGVGLTKTTSKLCYISIQPLYRWLINKYYIACCIACITLILLLYKRFAVSLSLYIVAYLNMALYSLLNYIYIISHTW